MRIEWRSCYVIIAILICVEAFPIEEDSKEIDDLSSENGEYGESSNLEDYNVGTTSSMKPPVRSSKYVDRLEPEAEMLPAHYTGVRPPGVDHMELRTKPSEKRENGVNRGKVPGKSKSRGKTGVKESLSDKGNKRYNTKGYRNVYHKSGYNKGADFYDDRHDRGHFA